MTEMPSLDECGLLTTDDIGGKARGLAALARAGFRVPPGFVVPTVAFRDAVARWGLRVRLGAIPARFTGSAASDTAASYAVSAEIRGLFDSHVGESGPLAEQVATGYARLGRGDAVPVAVRSSAVAEDTANASFAGQHETYLGVCGGSAVARAVVRCWGSLFAPEALSYRARLGVPIEGVSIAVVVQVMVPAEAAGVMMTLDPVSGDRSQICIEASDGLGVAVVNGEVDPDRFAVDKVALSVRSRTVGRKAVAYRFDPDAREVRRFDVSAAVPARPCVTDEEVLGLAETGRSVERAFGAPQDIEWALDERRRVVLLQSRPETVWSRRPREAVAGHADLMTRMVRGLTMPVSGPNVR